jgi:hypothetical protein
LTRDTGSGNYFLRSIGGEQKQFDSSGRLTGLRTAGGKDATLSYDPSSPSQVSLVKAGTPSAGWEYAFSWSGGNVDEIIYRVSGRDVIFDYKIALKSIHRSVLRELLPMKKI